MSKGYLCLDLLTHTLYTCMHVLFNEAKFPYSSTPSSASISHTPNLDVWLSNLLYLHSSNQGSILGPYSTPLSHPTNPIPTPSSHTSCHFPQSDTSTTSQSFAFISATTSPPVSISHPTPPHPPISSISTLFLFPLHLHLLLRLLL